MYVNENLLCEWRNEIMEKRKIISVVLFIAIILSLPGCSQKKMEVFIKPEIDEYSPIMSHVPGIPLNAVFNSSLSNKNLKYHWIAEQGVFLKWQEQGVGKIHVMGNDIKINEPKIYWTVDIDKKISESSFKIFLKVEDINSLETLAETSIEIVQKREGFFTVKD